MANGHGGKREGAGRPKGYVPKIRDFVSAQEVEEFVADITKRAKNSDKLAAWLGDQIFGKARQNLGIDGGEEGKALVIELSEAIAKKHDINTSAKSDSEK